MYKIIGSAFVCIAATSSVGYAQDFDGLFAEGYAEGSHIWIGSDSDSFFAVDTDFGYRASDAGNFGSIGGTLGVEYFSNDDADIEAFYGSLDIGLGPGTLSIGSPRSVYDRGYITEHQIGLSTLAQLNKSAATGSTYRTIYYLSDGKTRGGLRWDGEYGNTRVGASYNAYEFLGADMNSTALAIHHDYGAVGSVDGLAAFAALELVDSPLGTDTNFAIGTDVQIGPWALGLNLNRTEAIIDTDTISAFANYSFGNGLQVDLSIASLDTSTQDTTFYGVGLRYMLETGFFFDASIVDTDTSGMDELIDVSLGFEF